MIAKKTPPRTRRKVRYAVVGLGHIAQNAVLPAFAHARRNSELAALVSDDSIKLRALGRRYRVPALHTYETFEELLGSGRIDAVYIALPNSLHRSYTEQAARAGIHVLCEKPLAVTGEDCAAMVRAADEGRVKLMTAYRLHFEAANMGAVEVVRSGRLGEPRLFSSTFTMQVKAGDIRLRRDLGGGTLYDIGIYCIQAARYLFRADPIEALALAVRGKDPRFAEVDEMTGAVLRFPGERLATFTTSFGAADVSSYRVVGTKGSLVLDPAYEYAGERRMRVTVGQRTRERVFKPVDQFAPELLHFSDCILDDRTPEPSGVEGRVDVEIIEALLRSAESGRPEALDLPSSGRRPSGGQVMRRPPVRKPELVHARPPTD
jgi:glucose-fructose oxidoreductase